MEISDIVFCKDKVKLLLFIDDRFYYVKILKELILNKII